MARRYTLGFSLCGLLAFAVQEVPYLSWFLWPPADNPLAGSVPINMFFGTLEKVGGVLTIALLILVVRKPADAQRREKNSRFVAALGWRKNKSRFFPGAVLCLAIYYVSWGCYFAGVTNAWLIVIGLSAVVPVYYFFVALWMRNAFAAATAVLFFVGHTGANGINFLL
ncbi:MAG: hypothetical protein LBL36_05510 [Clostridiales Family XIII bacterium]|jgi:hypothetical protein|nr:hypothetical protein [Clostridiales Family XIII bacterium]